MFNKSFTMLMVSSDTSFKTLSPTYPSIHPPINQSNHLPVHPPTHQPTHPPTHPSTYPRTYHPMSLQPHQVDADGVVGYSVRPKTRIRRTPSPSPFHPSHIHVEKSQRDRCESITHSPGNEYRVLTLNVTTLVSFQANDNDQLTR